MRELTLKEHIKANAHRFSRKAITLGFDGFVDTIVRVIRQKEDKRSTYFESIREFGNYTVGKSGKNFSLELEERVTKLGGNMPIMANALGQLGFKPSCIGSFGYPDIHPVFQQMSANTCLHTFANPGISTAMEFSDGKILLAQMESLNKSHWTTIKNAIGIQAITALFTARDLIAIVNWSELDNATELWRGLLSEILPNISASEKRPIGFFDLSDCSRRSHSNILEAMALLKSFSQYWDVVLSLNLNEATVVYEALTGESRSERQIEMIGEMLYDKLGIDTVLIHYSKEALALNAEGIHKKECIQIKNPVLSTGAGDNFNAGFCAARLMQLDSTTSIEFGHATASYYLQTGRSPGTEELLAT